jgi:uncharacterized protein YegP (UPF0339 family)
MGNVNVASEHITRERSPMAASDLQFLIIHDVKDGYRWRLRAARGETVDFSRRGYRNKSDCEQEVQNLRNDEYPGARVRDLSVNRTEN